MRHPWGQSHECQMPSHFPQDQTAGYAARRSDIVAGGCKTICEQGHLCILMPKSALERRLRPVKPSGHHEGQSQGNAALCRLKAVSRKPEKPRTIGAWLLPILQTYWALVFGRAPDAIRLSSLRDAVAGSESALSWHQHRRAHHHFRHLSES
jgi:hypothetical protein